MFRRTFLCSQVEFGQSSEVELNEKATVIVSTGNRKQPPKTYVDGTESSQNHCKVLGASSNRTVSTNTLKTTSMVSWSLIAHWGDGVKKKNHLTKGLKSTM
jgi:hypothetical protein